MSRVFIANSVIRLAIPLAANRSRHLITVGRDTQRRLERPLPPSAWSKTADEILPHAQPQSTNDARHWRMLPASVDSLPTGGVF